jgi:hypothetical protein
VVILAGTKGNPMVCSRPIECAQTAAPCGAWQWALCHAWQRVLVGADSMGPSIHLLFFLCAGEIQLIYCLPSPSPSKPEDRPRTPTCVCIVMPSHCLLAQLLVRPVTTGLVCCTPSRPSVRANTHTHSHPDTWRHLLGTGLSTGADALRRNSCLLHML